VADAVVADACHLCRRARGRARPTPALQPFHRALSAPVSIRIVPGVRVTGHPVCASCAARVPLAGPDGALAGGIGVLAPFRTGGDLLRLLHLVKFSGLTSLIPGMAEAVAMRAAGAVAALDRPVLVPVPMDARAVRRRGFNQSGRIAGHVARRLGVALAPGALVKPRAVTPQSLTDPGRRIANVRGAFAAGPDDVAGWDVVLVDDLVTTGATAAEAARILTASGARSVTVVAVGTAL